MLHIGRHRVRERRSLKTLYFLREFEGVQMLFVGTDLRALQFLKLMIGMFCEDMMSEQNINSI